MNGKTRSMKKISRRLFTRNMALSSMMLAIHPGFACSHSTTYKKPKIISNKPRIQDLKLLTSASLDAMKEYYVNLLGMELVSHTNKELTIMGGQTPITFIKSEDAGDPWYHFAFNIPENKILGARDWQLERTPLVPTPYNKIHKGYPNDVRHFRHWNAHSVFFWDPAGNLLEYIARHDMNNAKPGNFSRDDILYASEIAFVVDDQAAEAKLLNKYLDLAPYPTSNNFWWSMGDESGLLLCIPKRIWGENTPNPKRFGVHPTEATILGDAQEEYLFDGFPYRVNVQKA